MRWLVISVVWLVLIVLLLPFALSLGFLKATVQGEVSSSLRGKCSVDDVSFSWFSGVSIQGLRIDNPPGFPTDRPAISIQSVHADVSLLDLAFGTPFAHAELQGLELNVEQNADGSTNLQALLPEESTSKAEAPTGGEQEPPAEPTPPSAPDKTLDQIAFDVRLVDAAITIRRAGQVLESLTDFDLTAISPADSPSIRVRADGKLQAGDLELAVDFDPTTESLDAKLNSHGLDLDHWRPLLDAFLPNQFTALKGQIDGELVAKTRRGGELDVSGDLLVRTPRIAGPVVQGMDLRAEQWKLTPKLKLGTGEQTMIDASGFAVDLEWLALRGRSGAKPRHIALGYDVDIARLAEFGGPLPALLVGSGARLTGDVQVPVDDLPGDADGWLRAIALDANVQVTTLDIAGFAVRNLGIDASVASGALQLATTESTLLDDGSLIASVAVDLTNLDQLPAKVALKWNGGKLNGGTTKWLRYAMPLFAGLEADIADVVGTVGLELSIDGPAMKRDDQDWVAWLDGWQGKGSLGLHDTAFAPAGELSGLLEPLGPLSKNAAPLTKDGRLVIASFAAPFSVAKGTVSSQQSQWQASGKSIGLSGTTTFAGALDYTIDLTPLLKGEKDGEKVLQALGGSLPPTRLQGTLDRPSLQLPELGDVASKLLQNEGQNLLKKGLNELFGGKKKQPD